MAATASSVCSYSAWHFVITTDLSVVPISWNPERWKHKSGKCPDTGHRSSWSRGEVGERREGRLDGLGGSVAFGGEETA